MTRKDTGLAATIAACASAILLLATAPAPVGATLPAGNLLANPGAEADVGSTDSSCGGDLDLTGWAPETGTFTAVQYGIGAFPSVAESTETGGGTSLFAGGCAAGGVSTGEQTADVSGAAQEIDAGEATATLSARLGGFSTQDDQAKVEAYFLGVGNADLGSAGPDVTIGPVTQADRGGVTDMLARSAAGRVPAGTRSIRTLVTMTRFSGTANDGYADNLSLTLAGSPAPPGPAPPAQPGPSQVLPRPVLGESVNVRALRGTVLVAAPPGSARASQKGLRFVRLTAARQIAVGSFLKTNKGTVQLTSARDSRGTTQRGEFSGGTFQVLQGKAARAGGLTELRLKGSSFARCRTRTAGRRAAAARLSRRKVRRLKSNATGRFRTRGRHSSATVRGTAWETIDRCDGTLTTVRAGKVAVRDFRRRKTVVVGAGKRYLARARR